jgi:hypothetical protein
MASKKLNNALFIFQNPEDRTEFLDFVTKYVENLSKKSQRYQTFRQILDTIIIDHECEEVTYRYYINNKKVAEGTKETIIGMSQVPIKANKKVTKVVQGKEITIQEQIITQPQT